MHLLLKIRWFSLVILVFGGGKRLIGKTQISWVPGTKNSFFPAIFPPGKAISSKEWSHVWKKNIVILQSWAPPTWMPQEASKRLVSGL